MLSSRTSELAFHMNSLLRCRWALIGHRGQDEETSRFFTQKVDLGDTTAAGRNVLCSTNWNKVAQFCCTGKGNRAVNGNILTEICVRRLQSESWKREIREPCSSDLLTCRHTDSSQAQLECRHRKALRSFSFSGRNFGRSVVLRRGPINNYFMMRCQTLLSYMEKTWAQLKANLCSWGVTCTCDIFLI